MKIAMKKKKPISIKLSRRGAFTITTSASGTIKNTKVAPRIQSRAIGTRADGTHFVEILFQPKKGELRSEFLEYSYLLPRKKAHLQERLADLGYAWPLNNKVADSIWYALAKTRPKKEFSLVDAPGWYGDSFALPDRFFSSDASAIPVLIDPRSKIHVGAFISGEGSLRGWKKSVGKLARKSSPLRVSIAATLAAPLLRKQNMDSFAINWFGPTSEGKSFLLKAGASVSGLIGPDGIPGWADSEAAFEGQAMGHRDCMMPLDESADGEDKMPLVERARMLAFGIARNRPRKFSPAYEKQHGFGKRDYRIVVQSSSERALHDVARDAGDPRLGGEAVRFMDVPASEPGSQGIFDGKIKPKKGKSLRLTAKAIIERTLALGILNQGHVLPAFLDRLMKDKNWEATIRRYTAQFESDVKAPDERAIYRIRSNWAIIWAAAALAIDYKLLPWSKRGTLRAIEKCFRRCIAVLASPPSVKPIEDRAFNSADLLRMLKERLDQSDLRSIQQRKKASKDEAAAREKADGFIIEGVTYVKNDRLEGWFPSSQDRSTLRKAGIFCTKRKDTPTVDRKINGIKGKPRYYVINGETLGLLPLK
jgi:Domain of unknown function (DUF927)